MRTADAHLRNDCDPMAECNARSAIFCAGSLHRFAKNRAGKCAYMQKMGRVGN